MDKNRLSILVTGGNGFLGSALVHKLIENHDVIVLEKNIDSLFRLSEIREKVKAYNSDPVSVNQIFQQEKVDVLIHTATLYGNQDTPLHEVLYSNVYMPLQVIETGLKHGVKAFINTDSFFNQQNSNYKYLGNYTLSKKQVNEWLTILSSKLPVINMRLQHMYGPGDNKGKFVMQMASSLASNTTSIDLTPGDQVRDFIYVDDVVSAFLAVLSNLNEHKNEFYQYEVGTSENVSIKQFIELMKELANSSSKLNFGKLKHREHEIMNSVADISALKKLNWKPETKLTTGIKNILKTL